MVRVICRSIVMELILSVLQTSIDETPTAVLSTEYVNIFYLEMLLHSAVLATPDHHRLIGKKLLQNLGH